MTSGRALMLAMIVLVLGAVSGGFYVLGSPGEQRLLRLDERRVEDLNGIRAGVNAYWRANQRLPESLDDARQGTALYRDPVSGQPYDYRVLDERGYELCATFDRAFTPEEPALAVRLWPHAAGRHCFTLSPERRP